MVLSTGVILHNSISHLLWQAIYPLTSAPTNPVIYKQHRHIIEIIVNQSRGQLCIHSPSSRIS